MSGQKGGTESASYCAAADAVVWLVSESGEMLLVVVVVVVDVIVGVGEWGGGWWRSPTSTAMFGFKSPSSDLKPNRYRNQLRLFVLFRQ